MLADRVTGPYAGPPAVRNEGLVQVQMTDVAAELASARAKPTSALRFCAVDVHLTAGIVHSGADVGDVMFVDAVRRRVA